MRQVWDWRGRALPSAATLRRILRHIEVAALEDRLRQLGEPRPAAPAPPQWQGVALDGKELRGREREHTTASCPWSSWSGMTGTQKVPAGPEGGRGHIAGEHGRARAAAGT